jgi:hypothetical protein
LVSVKGGKKKQKLKFHRFFAESIVRMIALRGIVLTALFLQKNSGTARMAIRLAIKGVGLAKIDVLLDVMVQHEASDLHISAGTPPMLRIDGELQRTKYHDLSPKEVEILLLELLDDEQLKLLKEKMDIDFAYEIEGVNLCFRSLFNPLPVFPTDWYW